MKLSEYRDEAALELLADISEPAIEIFADKQLIELIKARNTSKANNDKYQ